VHEPRSVSGRVSWGGKQESDDDNDDEDEDEYFDDFEQDDVLEDDSEACDWDEIAEMGTAALQLRTAALHGCVLQTVQELDSQPETPTSESAELNNEAESVVVSQPAPVGESRTIHHRPSSAVVSGNSRSVSQSSNTAVGREAPARRRRPATATTAGSKRHSWAVQEATTASRPASASVSVRAKRPASATQHRTAMGRPQSAAAACELIRAVRDCPTAANCVSMDGCRQTSAQQLRCKMLQSI